MLPMLFVLDAVLLLLVTGVLFCCFVCLSDRRFAVWHRRIGALRNRIESRHPRRPTQKENSLP